MYKLQSLVLLLVCINPFAYGLVPAKRADLLPAASSLSPSTASAAASAVTNVCDIGCKGCDPAISGTPGFKLRRRVEENELAAAQEDHSKRSLKQLAQIPDADKYVISQLFKNDDLDWGTSKTDAVSADFPFVTKAFNKWIAGINGCTAIAIVSEKGMWFAHFMEPGFIGGSDLFEQRWTDMLGVIANGRAAPFPYTKPADLKASTLSGSGLQLFISAPRKPESSQDNPEFLYPRVDELLNLFTGVGAPFAGVPVVKRGYLKQDGQAADDNAATKANGKVLVQFDPNQRDAQFREQSPRQAIYRVWLEQSHFEHTWTATPCQNGNAPQKRGASSSAGSCPFAASTSSSFSVSSTSRAASSSTLRASSTFSTVKTASASTSQVKSSTTPAAKSSSTLAVKSSTAAAVKSSTKLTVESSTKASTKPSPTPSATKATTTKETTTQATSKPATTEATTKPATTKPATTEAPKPTTAAPVKPTTVEPAKTTVAPAPKASPKPKTSSSKGSGLLGALTGGSSRKGGKKILKYFLV